MFVKLEKSENSPNVIKGIIQITLLTCNDIPSISQKNQIKSLHADIQDILSEKKANYPNPISLKKKKRCM